MNRRRLTTLVTAVAAAAALLAQAAPAGAGSPSATASGEELVSYVTTDKLKASKHIAYQVACGANCSLSVTSKLKLKGPDLGPATSTGSLGAGQTAEAFLEPNGAALKTIKQNIKTTKLITEITATNLLTGEVDTDSQTFKFKR